MATKTLLSLEGIGFRYESGDEIIKDITLSIEEGAFYFLIGVSGVGKTTLLKLMYTALRPSHGLLTLFGHEMAVTNILRYPLIRRRIGGILDDLPLIDHMSVEDNIALPLIISGFPKEQQKSRVKEIITWVHLDKFQKYYPPMLSSGQRQRVAIARAVVSNPSLFLADEPTANVDEKMAERLLFLIRNLHANGTTVIVATHNVHLLSKIKYARILHMKNGYMKEYPSYTSYQSQESLDTL